ncbi:MFS transporter [Streptomyces sp. NPDC007905]|uniref:MFS transporter n=1 Tax=Streptomyces sp. NPDC007905 TaxID=3364788 RepID=UPI0036E5339F
MTDRVGQRTTLSLWLVASATACIALAVVRTLPAVMVLAFCLGCTMEVQRPAVSAEINERVTSEAGRTRAQSWMYWVTNVGVSVSGGVGGYLAHSHGYRILFVLNGLACVAAAVIARRVLSSRPAQAPCAAAPLTYRQVLSDPALRWIAVAAGGAMISAYGLVSVLPLVMSADGLPPTAYGTAMIANTVAVLILSPPLTRLLVGRDERLRCDMVRRLKAAEDQGRLISKLTSYLRPIVLVVDEVGYQPLERAEANLVFQVISKRYEKGSIILTSNKTFGEWGQVFGDEVLATAILDRLLHHCEVVSINGNSYRLKNRLQAIERDTDVA